MTTIAELEIALRVNTSAVEKGINASGRLDKAFNKAAGKMESAAKKIENAMKGVNRSLEKSVTVQKRTVASGNQIAAMQIRVSKATGQARRQFEDLRDAMKRAGASRSDIAAIGSALGTFNNSMRSAKVNSERLARAQELLKNKFAVGRRVMRSYNSELRKTRHKEAAQDANTYKKRLTELTKSVQLALGPLSGVASRITAISSLMTTGTAVFAIFIGAAIGFTAALIKTAKVGRQFELEFLRIDAIIKATGRSADITAGQVNNLATEVGIATLTSAGQARQASAIILSFNKIASSSLETVLKGAQDLAAVMKTDITSAARIYGRALHDPIGSLESLRRAGITFTASQKDMMKTLVDAGELAIVQELIFDKLNHTIGGAGVREARGFAGALDSLIESLNIFLETTAKFILPELTISFQNAAETIKKWAEETDAAATVAGYFKAAIVGLTGLGTILEAVFDVVKYHPSFIILGKIADLLVFIGQLSIPELHGIEGLEKSLETTNKLIKMAEDIGTSPKNIQLKKLKAHRDALDALLVRLREQKVLQDVIDKGDVTGGAPGLKRSDMENAETLHQRALESVKAFADAEEKGAKATEKLRLEQEKLDFEFDLLPNVVGKAVDEWGGYEDAIAGVAGREAALKMEIEAETAAIDALAQKVANEGVEGWEDYEKGLENARKGLIKYNKKQAELNKDIDTFSKTVASGFASGIVAGERLNDVFADIGRSLARMIIQAALYKAIMGAFGIPTTGGTTLSTGHVDPGVRAGRARGGPVSAGEMFLVGEKGPELFVPGSNGGIVPNNRLGGGKVTVNVINNAGADIGVEESQDGSGGTSISIMVNKAAADDIRSNGILNSAIQGTFNTQRRLVQR